MDSWGIVSATLPSIMSALAIAGLGKIYGKLETIEEHRREIARQAAEEKEALKNGVCAMLRNNILHVCKKYISRGEKPLYEVNNVERMYEAYHALGGNGSVTRMVELFNELPISVDSKRD